MHAKLLDVAQDEESVLNLSLLHDLLQVLVLDEELVDQLLHFGKGKPNDQVSF